MNDELPRRRSLESLKKEAKRWLDALEAKVDDARIRLERLLPHASARPALREVQRALALEHGFPGWAALKDKLSAEAALSAKTLEHYERMAAALLEAYRTGTPEAMERHWGYTWHRRQWRGMRTYVQIDLGKPAGDDVEITIDDARLLVAREHGFENWAALAKYVATMSVAGPVMSKPVSVLAAPAHDTASSSREWTTVMRSLTRSEAVGLDAHGQMTDALLADVTRVEHLTTLRLGGSKGLTDQGVQVLARLPRLTHLDLSGTAITDRGLAVLRELPDLRWISVAWTRVSDHGVAMLAGSHGLEHVDLSGTACGDGAIKTFTGKPRLRHFLSGNAVTDDGLALFHEYPVFKHWQGGDPSFALLSYDTEPNRLLLRGPFTDRGMARLRGLDGLFGLNLDASELRLTGAALAPLVDLPRLGWLAFDAKDDAMPYIAQMPRLRFLGCQDTTATDDGWVALSRSQSLEQIWGRRCYGLQRRGFVALSTMPSLRGLSVSCKNVDDAGVAALPHFPALEELMPMDVPDAGYRHVGRCAQLESLVLMYCRDTSDAATKQITGLSRLTRYFASYTQVTDRTPELLSGMDSLEQITFDGCAGLTNRGIGALARLPRLRELRVSGQRITPDVVSTFPPTVTVHYSL
ncbi:MAG: hypothetical protein ACT4P7_17240 [Gemmatimonadaceae bacterium]